MLQRRRRLTYGTRKRQFQLDDAVLEDTLIGFQALRLQGAREGQGLYQAMDKDGLQGGKGDNNAVGRPRHIHDPGIQ